ncbi:hypothetical protein LTW04_24990 [Escherichia coli]|uniref:hypothetical protein n=1 Tax=Escherichia coli TaxID=562 RepID=UPI001E2931EF|nr:hypothetical protein [Escherichia coli]MCD6946297.1 hypothetical protein [Escherichia coli]MCD6966062.1 hypothetical protein [Escherichia coli]
MLFENSIKKQIKAKRKKANKIFWTCHYIEKKYPRPIFIALLWLASPLMAYIKLFPQTSTLTALLIYGFGIIIILSVWFYLGLPKSWIDSLDRQILKYRSDTSFIGELENVHIEEFIDHGKIIVPILDIQYWAINQKFQLNRLLRKEISVKIKK